MQGIDSSLTSDPDQDPYFDLVLQLSWSGLLILSTSSSWQLQSTASSLGSTSIIKYPLVNQHNYGQSQCSMGTSTINGHFQKPFVCLPEGIICNQGGTCLQAQTRWRATSHPSAAGSAVEPATMECCGSGHSYSFLGPKSRGCCGSFLIKLITDPQQNSPKCLQVKLQLRGHLSPTRRWTPVNIYTYWHANK